MSTETKKESVAQSVEPPLSDESEELAEESCDEDQSIEMEDLPATSDGRRFRVTGVTDMVLREGAHERFTSREAYVAWIENTETGFRLKDGCVVEDFYSIVTRKYPEWRDNNSNRPLWEYMSEKHGEMIEEPKALPEDEKQAKLQGTKEETKSQDFSRTTDKTTSLSFIKCDWENIHLVVDVEAEKIHLCADGYNPETLSAKAMGLSKALWEAFCTLAERRGTYCEEGEVLSDAENQWISRIRKALKKVFPNVSGKPIPKGKVTFDIWKKEDLKYWLDAEDDAEESQKTKGASCPESLPWASQVRTFIFGPSHLFPQAKSAKKTGSSHIDDSPNS